MFKVTPIPAFQDNYIWLLEGESAGQVAVVDPGDAKPVLDYLQQHQLTLAAILITHHHNDHTGGVADLTAHYTIPVYGPLDSPFSGITAPLRQDSEIRLLGHRLQVHAVPAHTRDHISYLQPEGIPQLFCGDTLFMAGCGRLFEGSARQMLDAMRYFASLPDQTQVYCTHEYTLANLAFARAVEPANQAIIDTTARCQALRTAGRPTLPSSIGTEKQINPFMRTRQPAVIEAAERFVGNPLDEEVSVLAGLREWKNRF